LNDLSFSGYRSFEATIDDPLRLKWNAMAKDVPTDCLIPLPQRAPISAFNAWANKEIKFDHAESESLEVWQSPTQTFSAKRGDCKDYALLKYAALKKAGVEVRIVLGEIKSAMKTNPQHAWCAANIDGIWYALDNDFDHLQPLPYLNWIPSAVLHDSSVVKFGAEFRISDIVPQSFSSSLPESNTMMTPRVVDLSHHNQVTDLKATAMAGVYGVIHKSSQGSGYRDPDYVSRRAQAKAAGLLWGAYHFNDGSDVAAQVDWFLKCAAPDDSTLLVLDFEDNPKSNMSIAQAVQFLRLLEQKTGRKGAIYSGNRLKETIHILGSNDRAYLCSHRLWLCQYGPKAVLPAGFPNYWLWQYTGDGIGPGPHGIPGIQGSGIDLNAYDGDRAKLKSEWAPGGLEQPDDQVSSHARQAAADDDGSDDVPNPQPVPQNVQPQSAAYSLDVEIVQRKLDRLGYHDVGDMDGKWGGKTKGALTAFLNDRGVDLVVNGGPTPEINNVISAALAEGWTRPISDTRANATAKDIAPKIEAVRQSLWQRFLAKITGAGAAGTALVTGVGSQFGSVNDQLSPVKQFFASIPGPVWFGLIALAALAVYLSANKSTNATVAAYNTGKIN